MATNVTTPRQAEVLGVPVSVCEDVLEAAIALYEQKGGGQIVTLNAEMTMAALADPALAGAIGGADLVIPDGAGVVWALGRQGIRVRRTPGIELARQLLEHAAVEGWRVALVGASPKVLEQLCPRLAKEIPGLQLVIAIHGYSDPRAWPALEESLLSMKPDLTLVALGVPRQELWIQSLPHPLLGLWMGVGGSFDVWAGTKKRAPRWMGQIHLEWLYRLFQEPSRWRRMLALPAFMRAVLSGTPPRLATRRPAAGRRAE
ncbi:MAG: WecB/TagA/CpsF family glycosyltransferase [Cyanobacteriota bacterium]